MEINTSPVKVEVVVENFNLIPDAFYTVCFIAESDEAPRTLNVSKLSDLLENGYMRYMSVYNFVYSVFAQRSMTNVIVRAKRTNETYEEAFSADENSNYYYIVIEDKNTDIVFNFNDYINQRDEFKLQFFSSTVNVSEQVIGRKIVYYYQPFFSSAYVPPIYSDGYGDYWNNDNNDTLDWDNTDRVTLEPYDMPYSEAVIRNALYPEGAWIGLCGYYFPSRIQWLHKYLGQVEGFKATTIPNLSTTSFMIRGTDKATAGSGMTGQSVPIHLQVSLDWLKYALQKSIWNKLYKEEVIPATSSGSLILENEVKRILDLCVTESMFSEYEVFSRNVDSKTSTASFKFKATLIHPILGVDKVDGVIYH